MAVGMIGMQIRRPFVLYLITRVQFATSGTVSTHLRLPLEEHFAIILVTFDKKDEG